MHLPCKLRGDGSAIVRHREGPLTIPLEENNGKQNNRTVRRAFYDRYVEEVEDKETQANKISKTEKLIESHHYSSLREIY